MALTAIDAFAGAGGLSLGVKRAGFDVRLAFDNDPIAVATHSKNFAVPAIALDAASVNGQELLSAAGLAPGELDLLAGGPPCQGFSLQRRGDRSDERNKLVLRYLDWIDEIRPKAFLIENVPAIRGVRGNNVLGVISESVARAGYSTHVATLNAADFGVAQVRRRAFLIGIAEGHSFEWPEPTHVGSHRTVRDAISDLPSPPEDGRPHSSVLNHYREARLSALNIERIKHVPEGGGRTSLPPHLELACHANGHRHLDTYGRLAWNSPSVTITARFDSFTRGRFGHPVEHRSITLREGARIQGFPDSFEFLGNREQGARLIGNAVPPLLGEHLARSIRSALLSQPTGQMSLLGLSAPEVENREMAS